MLEGVSGGIRKMSTQFEKCNCDQALEYKKAARKLALAVKRYCEHDNQEKYGSIFYLAETISPLVYKVLEATK